MDQLLLDLDWGREPWSGLRPRCLTRRYLQDVDKSDTLSEPATVNESFTDPAQYQMLIHSAPPKEV